ncbi:MAG: 4Fe-4S binding protein [Bacteroidota bacterium]
MKKAATIIYSLVIVFSSYSIYAQCTGCSVEDSCTDKPKAAPIAGVNSGGSEKAGGLELLNSGEAFGDFYGSKDSPPPADPAVSGIAEEDDKPTTLSKLKWPLLALGLTAIAGFMVRNPITRKFRLPMLLGSLIFFGFYLGGCPCPISSVQDTALGLMGVSIQWHTIVWFLGLIPLTYIFGKTWCGWVCHLGGLQEFLYKSNKLEFLRSEKSQKIMKYMRLGLLAALIVQMFLTQSNLFCKIDPFKAAFNLNSFYLTAWILLGLLILSSLFIYRPFCKAVCPIGLMLGWAQKIPGASVLAVNDKCNGCNSGNKACEMDAYTGNNGFNLIDNKECMACGECIDACKPGAIEHRRKNRQHRDTAIFPGRVSAKNDARMPDISKFREPEKNKFLNN